MVNEDSLYRALCFFCTLSCVSIALQGMLMFLFLLMFSFSATCSPNQCTGNTTCWSNATEIHCICIKGFHKDKSTGTCVLTTSISTNQFNVSPYFILNCISQYYYIAGLFTIHAEWSSFIAVCNDMLIQMLWLAYVSTWLNFLEDRNFFIDSFILSLRGINVIHGNLQSESQIPVKNVP